MASFRALVTWYVRMAHKIGFHSLFGLTSTVESSHFVSKYFGQACMKQLIFFVVSFSYVDHGQILLDVGLLQERLPADWLLGGLQSLCSKVIPRLYHGAEALSQRPRAGDGQNYKGPPLATVLRKEG